MRWTVLAARIFVGLLFIISGLVKANDPLGLAYKMDEYFAVLGVSFFSKYSLVLSIVMNTFEIVAGLAIILGYRAKQFIWLLLLLILFFTFLTGYSAFSGKIKSCGCFGECLPLTAYQSFYKDLLLLGLILFLLWRVKEIKPLLPAKISLFLLLFSTGLVVFGQINALKNLPYVDCLPYAKNKDLLKGMQAPPGSVPDSTVVKFTYKKDGKELSFTADEFPADFDEETYTYVGRKDVVVRKGNATPAIMDLAFYTQSRTDTTRALLASSGPYVLFFARNFDGQQPGWFELFGKLYLKAKHENIPFYIVSNQPEKAESFFNGFHHFNAPVLTLDGTVMKTFLRTETGVVLMDGPVVKAKYPEVSMNNVIRDINQLKRP